MARSGSGQRDVAERSSGLVNPGEGAIEEAVRVLQAGDDPDAFEPIFERFYKPLHNFFANRPALREQADDLAQETLLRAYQNIAKYQFQSKGFAPWLWQIGQNVWKNAVRKRLAAKRGGGQEVQAPRPADGSENAEPHEVLFTTELPSPEARALAAERQHVLADALGELPEGMRRCTELRLGDDLKYQEIADILEIGLNSVRSQLFEARKRLRPILEQYFSDADL